MKTLKRPAAIFVLFLVFLVFPRCVAHAQRMQVLLPDGTPAADAEAIVRKSSHRDAPDDKVRETTHTADKDGWLDIPTEFEWGFSSLLIVQAENAAIGVWNFPGGETLQLAEEFKITGRAVTLGGRPVSKANVQIVHFGLYTYAHIFSELLRDVEGFCTTTDKDGNFELPGVTLNDYKFPPGAIVWVKGEVNGRIFTGEGRQSYIGNLKVEDYHNVERDEYPITMHPISRVSGKVINAATGNPLTGATMTYHSVHDIYGEPVVTDDEGRFSISNLPSYRKRRFRVNHESLAQQITVVESAQPNQSNPDVEGLVVEAWPAQLTSGKVVDEITGEATLIPLELHYKQIGTPFEGWQAVTSGRFGKLEGAGRTQADGSFRVPLPLGEIELRLVPSTNRRLAAYDHTWKLNLKAGENEIDTLRIPRRKGLFAKMVITDPPADENAFWKSVTIINRKTGSPSYSYARSGRFWFYPVQEWGDQVDIEIFQRDQDSNRVTIFPQTTFTANEMAWPTEIEIRPIR